MNLEAVGRVLCGGYDVGVSECGISFLFGGHVKFELLIKHRY